MFADQVQKTYKTVGWLTKHMTSVHPQCTILYKGSAAPTDNTFESKRSTTKEVYPG